MVTQRKLVTARKGNKITQCKHVLSSVKFDCSQRLCSLAKTSFKELHIT